LTRSCFSLGVVANRYYAGSNHRGGTPRWPRARRPHSSGLVLSALLVALFLAACGRPEERPSIILISIDTLRADHLHAYGYRGIATPNIDALARDGVIYRNAWSHCPLTLPSHLSILTGLLPPEHGVRDNAGYRFEGTAHPTLPSLLQKNGYATGAAVSAYVLRASTGVSAGFDDYDDAIGVVDGAPLGALQRLGGKTEAIAERWIDVHQDKPFFYFLHIYEPHTPYQPTYDADVAASDTIIGKLIAHLKQRGVYDNALIILTSDHGEGLMEHGEAEHGVFLYREDLHVPLIVKLPHAARRGSVDSMAQLIDITPTVLDAAGIAPLAAMHGVSLLAGPKIDTRTSYAESFYPRIHLGWSELRSVVRGALHVIDAPKPEVYDLHADADERINVIDRERRAYTELRDVARSTGSFEAPDRVDPEEAKKLAALGYVSAGSDAGNGPLPDPKDVIGQLASLKAAHSVDDLKQLLASNPRWSDVREQLGAEYDRAGDHAAAARVYEEGIRTTPRLAGTFALSAGYALIAMGDLNGAAAHTQLALAAGEPGAHLLLGEIALARKDAATGWREEAAAEEVASQKAHALFLAARIAAMQRDYVRTLRILDEVQRVRAASSESLPEHFHYVAGDALARTNRRAEAEREMEREIVDDPHDLRAYVDLSLLQFIGGHREDAQQTLAKLAAMHLDTALCTEVARELEAFGDAAGAKTWRLRSQHVHGSFTDPSAH
jgi:arylsulfatase A-like enzyme